MGQPQLQSLLEEILGSDQVYFQPPDDVEMHHPAIVYRIDFESVQHADDRPYNRKLRWIVTLISRDPMDPVRDKIAELPLCSFERAFPADHLNHQAFNLYY